MFCNFKTTTHGKWILAGEHSVLRGHGALVFPISNRQLILRYNASNSDLAANYSGESGADLHLLFWGVLEQGAQILNQSLNDLNGNFHLECNIPIGVGMGASAALCVATARWFCAQKILEQEQVFDFSKQLENLFHGESSGLDIAGVSNPSGMYFTKKHRCTITPKWQPLWYLSSCEQISITSHCIGQVKTLWSENPKKAGAIDKHMSDSVEQARKALANTTTGSHIQLAHAINQAGACFEQWGLVTESLEQHMKALRDAGAVAVKPTGSGSGGHVISLWDKEPTGTSIQLTKL